MRGGCGDSGNFAWPSRNYALFAPQLVLLCSGYVAPSALVSAKLFLDKDTGMSKGYAFVTLDSPGAAKTLRDALNGSVVNGRRLTVDVSSKGRAPGT